MRRCAPAMVAAGWCACLALAGCAADTPQVMNSDVEGPAHVVVVGDVTYEFEATSCVFMGNDLLVDGPGTSADGTGFYVKVESSQVDVTVDGAEGSANGTHWRASIEDYGRDQKTATAQLEFTEVATGQVAAGSLSVTCQ